MIHPGAEKTGTFLRFLFTFLCLLLLPSTCPSPSLPSAWAAPSRQVAPETSQKQGEITLEWLGHSAFLIKGHSFTILTDPYNEDVGYPLRRVEADVVTISHEHFDHNFLGMVKDSPEVLRGLKDNGTAFSPLDKAVKGVHFKTLPSFHDDVNGRERGPNAIFVMEAVGLRIVHLGDLGEAGSISALASQPVDLLLIPVGGTYTIGPQQAKEIIKKLKPKVTIPMHYKTEPVRLPLEGVGSFLRKAPFPVRTFSGPRVTLSRKSLPTKPVIFLLDWKEKG